MPNASCGRVITRAVWTGCPFLVARYLMCPRERACAPRVRGLRVRSRVNNPSAPLARGSSRPYPPHSPPPALFRALDCRPPTKEVTHSLRSRRPLRIFPSFSRSSMSTADEATRTVPQPKAVVVPAPSKKKKAAVMLPTADEVEALVVLMVAFFIAKGDAGKANPIKLRVLLGTHAGKERTLLEKIAADQNGGDGPVEDAATRASAWWLSQGGDAGRKRKRASDATKAAPREMVAPAALPSFAPGAEPLAPSASMFFFGATHEGEEAAPHPVAVGAASAFAAAASLTGLDELRRKLPHGSAGRIVNSFVIPWHPDAILHQRGLHVAMQADRHDSLCSIWDEQRGAGYSFVRFCDPRLGRLSSRLDGYEHSLDDDPPDDPDDGHAYLTRCCFCNDPVQVHCEFGPKWVKIGDGGKGDLKHPLHITDPDKIFCGEFGTPMGWYLRLDGADCDRQLDDREDEDAVCDTCGMDSAFLCCDFCTPDLPGVYRCYECRKCCCVFKQPLRCNRCLTPLPRTTSRASVCFAPSMLTCSASDLRPV